MPGAVLGTAASVLAKTISEPWHIDAFLFKRAFLFRIAFGSGVPARTFVAGFWSTLPVAPIQASLLCGFVPICALYAEQHQLVWQHLHCLFIHAVCVVLGLARQDPMFSSLLAITLSFWFDHHGMIPHLHGCCSGQHTSFGKGVSG